MNMFSFANGNTSTIETQLLDTRRKTVTPYDPTARFNRVVDQKGDDRSTTIWSIDANAFLKTLEKDNLEDIFKITLVCRPAHDGVGVWDTLFNNTARQSVSACIFAAQNDFSPIPQSRVLVTSQFLNFSMSTSRVHLNKIHEGDRIGIAINDMSSQTLYILFYLVEDKCYISTDKNDDDDRVIILPAVNLKMEHAHRLDYNGVGVVVNMQEEVEFSDNAKPFMTWLTNTVLDVSESYPWKPHFLPVRPRSIDLTEIEQRLLAEMPLAKSVSYLDFEKECRSLYQSYKAKRPVGPRKRPKSNQHPTVTLPVMEVVKCDNRYQIKLDDEAGSIFTFHEQDLGTRMFTETYLTNKDLEGINILESPKITLLSKEVFGENATLRFLTLNF